MADLAVATFIFVLVAMVTLAFGALILHEARIKSEQMALCAQSTPYVQCYNTIME